MILADKIIAERKKNGWSQEELAEQLGVTRQSVSKWEGALATPDLQRIVQMSQVFHVSTDYLLKDEIESESFAEYAERNADHTENADTDGETVCRRVSMEEANRFLKVKKQTAPQIAMGVFFCIVSPIPLLLLAAAQEMGYLGIRENAAGGIGVIVLLLTVAAATVVFIFCGMKTKEYEYLEKEDIETEYGVAGMVKERRKQYEPQYIRYNVFGTVLCIVGLLPLFAASIFTENDFVLVAMVCALLLLAAMGVRFFIVAGIMNESFEKLLQEGEYSSKAKKRQPLKSTVVTGYWLIVTAIYVGVSLYTNAWGLTWIMWVVAGIMSPIVSFIAGSVAEKK